MKRRLFLASSVAAAVAAGCAPIGTALNNNNAFHGALESAQTLDRALIGTRGMARLYTEADIDRTFRVNGFDTPSDDAYQTYVRDRFSSYRLLVDGAVQRSAAFTLGQLERMMQLTQITRHDCVEGWSAIGKWGGVPLRDLLAAVGPTSAARYVVFRCMDNDGQGNLYYESLGLHQAMHPQTLLALRLNGAPLDPAHGAPVRLRVPTQLGYKSAKWVRHIQVVPSFNAIDGGQGGYWEDQGYEWFAGI
jgi:DMSO/TMAO reductase YedYZ molybdopterin-dependent catalytic subunit